MSEHTPGPWEVATKPNGNGTRTTVETEWGNFVALTGETDARLIAAAPDLLEACKAIVETYARHNVPPDAYIARDLPALRAAIAKATP